MITSDLLSTVADGLSPMQPDMSGAESEADLSGGTAEINPESTSDEGDLLDPNS